MRNVIATSIERFISFALFTLGIAAVVVAAAASCLSSATPWVTHEREHQTLRNAISQTLTFALLTAATAAVLFSSGVSLGHAQ